MYGGSNFEGTPPFERKTFLFCSVSLCGWVERMRKRRNNNARTNNNPRSEPPASCVYQSPPLVVRCRTHEREFTNDAIKSYILVFFCVASEHINTFAYVR